MGLAADGGEKEAGGGGECGGGEKSRVARKKRAEAGVGQEADMRHNAARRSGKAVLTVSVGPAADVASRGLHVGRRREHASDGGGSACSSGEVGVERRAPAAGRRGSEQQLGSNARCGGVRRQRSDSATRLREGGGGGDPAAPGEF